MKKNLLVILLTFHSLVFATSQISTCNDLAHSLIKDRASKVIIIYTQDNAQNALICQTALLNMNSDIKIVMDPQEGANFFKAITSERYSVWKFWK